MEETTMKIARMTPYAGETKTRAFFDLETDEGITIKGFTLVDGPKGLFVSVPSDKGKDDKYYEQVIIPQELKKEVNKMALSKYKEARA